MSRATAWAAVVAALAAGGCGKGAPAPSAPETSAPAVAVADATGTASPVEADTVGASAPADVVAVAPDTAPAPVAAMEPEGSPRAVALVAALERMKRVAVDDEALASLADDVVVARVGDPYLPEVRGRAEVLARLQAAASVIRYFAATPERLYEAGDWIAIDAVLFGHHTGEVLGRAPTGAIIGVALVLACHFGEDGKIDRVETYFDGEALRRQLGILDTPAGGKHRLIAGPTDDEAEYTRGAPSPDNEALVRRADATLADGSIDAAWDTLFAPHFEFENVNENARFRDKASYLAYWREPTEHGVKRTPGAALERVLSVEDRVLTWSVVKGTYTGEGAAAVPAGTEVTQHVFDIWTLADGRIVRRKSFTNGLEVMAQLGLLGDLPK